MTEQRYNLYDLGYNKNISRFRPIENQESKNNFDDYTPLDSLGSTESGKYLSDVGEVAFMNEEDIQIEDIINDRINTQSAEILAEWTFGESGAFAVKVDDNNGLWFSPTGILAKKLGVIKFTITDSGDATFAGELVAATGTLGTITAGTFQGVTLSIGSGNSIFKATASGIQLGHNTFSSAPFRVDMSGNLTATSATITGALTTGAGSALNLDYVNAGTLTGRTVRTAASGSRVLMDGSDNTLKIYDSSNLRMQLNNQYLTFTGGAANDGVQLYQSAYRQMKFETPVTAMAFDVVGLMPTSGSLDLGGTASANRWANIYGNFIRTYGNLQVDGRVSSNLLPSSSATYDLGSSTYKWRDLWVSQDIKSVRNLKFTPGTVASAEEGNFYFDSSTKTLRYYNGTVWKTIATL